MIKLFLLWIFNIFLCTLLAAEKAINWAGVTLTVSCLQLRFHFIFWTHKIDIKELKFNLSRQAVIFGNQQVINPFKPKISLFILLSVCHIILTMFV